MARQTLRSAKRLGLLGDTHGNLEHLFIAAKTLRDQDVSTFVVLGDWGFVWPRKDWNRTLDRIEHQLGQQTMLFVDGNHDWIPKLVEFPIGRDGVRWLRPNIGHLPRGWRLTLDNGHVLAALGGASSVDRHLRTEGEDWWPEESITEPDLAALGEEMVTILLGHEAPTPLPVLDKILAAGDPEWPADAIAASDESRRMLSRALEHTSPRWYFGGHMHHFVVDYWMDTRVMLLDRDEYHVINVGVVDLSDLSVIVSKRSGAQRSAFKSS
ncbi:metallophosphoesterase family protein [Microcella sp.]|uniref:metallophosphoesterase family protein n=1 Tax=Microcella sp. TaxID=1913979 RepID=UPI003F7180B5